VEEVSYNEASQDHLFNISPCFKYQNKGEMFTLSTPGLELALSGLLLGLFALDLWDTGESRALPLRCLLFYNQNR